MELSRWYVRVLFARVPPEYQLSKNRTLEGCEGILALLQSADRVDFAEPSVHASGVQYSLDVDHSYCSCRRRFFHRHGCLECGLTLQRIPNETCVFGFLKNLVGFVDVGTRGKR